MQWAKASINNILFIDYRKYFSEYRTYGFEKEDYNSKRTQKKEFKRRRKKKAKRGETGKKTKKREKISIKSSLQHSIFFFGYLEVHEGLLVACRGQPERGDNVGTALHRHARMEVEYRHKRWPEHNVDR